MFPLSQLHSTSQSQEIKERASFRTCARPEADRRRNRTGSVRKNCCRSPRHRTYRFTTCFFPESNCSFEG